jgi:N-acetylneuraminic acid mutarotase
MKDWIHHLCLLVLIFLADAHALFSQPVFERKTSIPQARYHGVSMVFDTYAIVGLGRAGQGGAFLNDLYKYDPIANSWEQLPDFPASGRYNATSFTINGKGYIGLGYRDGYGNQNDLWEFDPDTKSFTRKADFPGIPRYSAFAFVIGNKAYVGTGTYGNPNDYLFDMWCYDPVANTWTKKADFPGGSRITTATFVIGSEGYVGGGASTTNTMEKDFWRYNPAQDKWTRIADYPDLNHDGAVAFVIDQQAYVGTGTNVYENTYHSTFYEYDPKLGQWNGPIIPPDDCVGRYGGVGFTLNNIGYFGNGMALNASLADLWSLTRCTRPASDFSVMKEELAVSFTNLSSNADSCLWTFGDGNASLVKDPFHVFDSAGKYWVCLYAVNACGEDIKCDSITVTVKVVPAEGSPCGYSLYPNPAEDFIFIEIPERFTSGLAGKIVDVCGKTVQYVNFSAPGKFRIDISILATGMYGLLIIDSNGKSSCERLFIKE